MSQRLIVAAISPLWLVCASGWAAWVAVYAVFGQVRR